MSRRINYSLFGLMLVIGLFQIAAYWFSGTMACSEGMIASPQPDTLLYCQSARRIVEKCPFSFSEGSGVCTGTTSVLYPFFLAVPYALGAKGESLLWAGFLLNACFYLAFLFGWSVAIKNWCQNLSSALLAAVLVALSGHCAYVTLAQSDIGLLLAYTGLLAAALSAERSLAIGVLLILGPWVRPEGIICVIAYCTITVVWLVKQRVLPDLCAKNSVVDYVICVLSIVSCLSVFGLNYALTGHAQFSSVAGKGYFVQYGFAAAFFMTITDSVMMFKELFLGLAKGVPRDFVSIPGIGALLLMGGIVVYRWRDRDVRGLFVLILAALGGLFSVAQSGWQDTNLDRYVVWMFPISIVFVSEMVSFVEARYMPPELRKLPSVLAISASAIGALALIAAFHLTSKHTDSSRHFAHDCDRVMEQSASFGGNLACEMVYFSSPRRFGHFCGIYSPEFSPKSMTENVERLRHCPETRFDYWVFDSSLVSMFGRPCVEKMGEVVLSGPEDKTLAKANWRPFDICCANSFNGLPLVASMEVGYEEDENHFAYNVIPRWGLEVFEPFVQGGQLGDKYIIDVGRVVLGGDELTISLKPGIDTIVVMRTWPSHVVKRTTGYPSKPIDCAFANPLKFNISVDGNVVDMAEVSYATNGFSDVSFKIPGAAIKNPVSRIGFLGDHITFGYWFYQ